MARVAGREGLPVRRVHGRLAARGIRRRPRRAHGPSKDLVVARHLPLWQRDGAGADRGAAHVGRRQHVVLHREPAVQERPHG